MSQPSQKRSFITSVADLEKLPDNNRPHVALVGRSNAGKSSLINALSGQTHLAKVSAEPGRTKTLNFFSIDPTYYLVDLPGYGYAKTSWDMREKYAELLVRYLQETRNIVLVCIVIDASAGMTEQDVAMVSFLQKAGRSMMIVANKIDKLTRSQVEFLKQDIAKVYPHIPVFPHSRESTTNRGAIREAFVQAARRKI